MSLVPLWLTIFGVIGPFVLTPLQAQAQPARDRVLGDVELTEYPEAVQIRVGFNFPVRYQGHFPTEKGEELRVQLAPIAVGQVDRDALFQRESYTPPAPNLAGVNEILFEGDMRSGFYLTLFFRGEAHWQVTQGSDYRSLQIEIAAPFPAQQGEVKREM